jgi:hypothetical protein
MADDLSDPEQWIAAFAKELGVAPPDATTVELLLELAGVAAHASARTAAPIACWLIGRAGLGAEAAIEIAMGVADSATGQVRLAAR